jgi:hypothetical protein
MVHVPIIHISLFLLSYLNMPETKFTPQNLTEKTLRYGYWFVTHKIMLKRIGIGLIILFDVITIGWSAWGWFSSYVLEADSDQVAAMENATSVLGTAVHDNAAKPFLVSNAQIFTIGGNADFSAEIKNPNANYRADFSYRFTSGGQATSERTGFVLPNDDKFITALGEKATGSQSAVLEISKIVWQKVDRHQIPDYQKFSSERLNFNLTDIKFAPLDAGTSVSGAVGAADKSVPTGKTTFTFFNNTGFGYKQIKFTILLFRGPDLVAVNSTILTDIIAGETRPVEVTWYQALQAISDTRVIPEVDILNDGVYLR